MKKKEDKMNKTVVTLNYLTAVCFYIVAIMDFVKDNTSKGVVFLCLGSTFLCLGSCNLNKDRKNKDNK